MRAIGIIPARMASTRFPGKPLAMIAGKPMLWHVCRAVQLSRIVYPYFVATPDREILDVCRAWGVPTIFTSPTCANGTARVAQAVNQLARRDPDEIIINVQGDEPAIEPETLDALALAFNDPAVKIASVFFRPAAAPGFIADPNRVKVLVNGAGDAALFTRTVHQAYLWRTFGQHVGVYGYRRETLAELAALAPSPSLEQLAWMRAGYRIRMVEIEGETVAVDMPEDLRRAESVLAARGL